MMADLFSYAEVPQETRRAAMEHIAPRADLIRAKVLRYMCNLAERGGKGITTDECADALGLNILTVRPRFTELRHAGMIEPTGGRRQNKTSQRSAAVWRVTEKGARA